jgi:hypothetical protein
MDNVEIKNLSEAKKEYTQQLINILKNDIYKGINDIYYLVKDENNYLEKFQSKLREIPKWNQDIIDQKYQDFITNTGCDWLDELLQAVFISNTAILTTVKSKNSNQNKIDLTIPKCSRFLHKCYIESAREIFKNPYLYLNNLDYKETQKNMRETLDLISLSIENSIRNLLPMKDILRQYLTGADINANKGTDFNLSDETITQKNEPTKDEKIIEKLEEAVEQINNNELVLENNAEYVEHNFIPEEEKLNTLYEKNKLLNENIEKLNDINSESEEDDNAEELIDYMKSLNKNIGTETEMKGYETETLIDNNLELTERKQINIADLSDKNFENHSIILDNNESDNEENLEKNVVEDNNMIVNNIETDMPNIEENLNKEPEIFEGKTDNELDMFKTNNFGINNENSPEPENLNLLINPLNKTKPMINQLETIIDNNVEENPIFNKLNLNTSTILPPNNFNDDDSSGENELDDNESKIGKYELNLENLELNNTLKEASNLIKNFGNEQELTKEIDEMKIDLTNINEINDNLELINSEKKEPNQIVINLKKHGGSFEKKDNITAAFESGSNEENELYQVDLPDDLK